MDKEKTKQTLRIIYGIFFIFFIMPSLLALVSTIGFLSLYFLITLPIFAEYQNQLTFRIGLVNIVFGVFWAHIIILFKSINHVFGRKIW